MFVEYKNQKIQIKITKQNRMISLFISLYYTCRTLVTLRSFIILPYAIYYAIYTSCKKINVRRIEIINA